MGRLGQKEHRITDAERTAVVRMRGEGTALKAIAEKLALPYSTVRWILAKAGVRASTAVRSANNRANYDRQEARKLAALGVTSREEWLQKLAAERGGEHTGKWVNTRTPTTFRCAKGHEFNAKPSNVQQGMWCAECVREARRITLEELAQLGESRQWKLLSTESLGVDDKHEWLCDRGHLVFTTATALRGGHGCQTCAGNAPLTVEGLNQLAEKKGWKFLDVEARGSQIDHLWQCAKGHKFKKWPNNVRHTGCPVCAAGRHVSKGQRWVFEIARSILPSQMKVELTDRLVIKPLELDVYVEDLKVAIEFDGMYWHSKPKVQDRDKRKVVACAQKGIELLRVAEESFMTDKEGTRRQIEQFLLSALQPFQGEVAAEGPDSTFANAADQRSSTPS